MTVPVSQTISDLRDAAEYMRIHGREIGTYGDHGGPRCAIGAILSACENHSDCSLWSDRTLIAIRYVSDSLGEVPKVWSLPTYHPLAHFNDNIAKSNNEVIDLFESVAMGLEIKELASAITTVAEKELVTA